MLMISSRNTLSLNQRRLNLLQWRAAFEAYAWAVDFAKQLSAVEACMESVQMYARACLAECIDTWRAFIGHQANLLR